MTQVFGDLDPGLLETISTEFESIDVAGGSELFHQGDPGDSLYILLRGRLNVCVADPETGLETVLGEIAPGEAVGEIGLLTGETRSASLWATRDSRLVRIGQEAFDALAEKHTVLLRQLAKIVVGRLQERVSSPKYRPRVSTIAIVPARQKNGTTRFVDQLKTTLERSGSSLHLDSERVDQLVGEQGISMAPRGSAQDTRLGQWLGDEESRWDFLLLEADAEVTEWTRRCLRQADMVLVVGNSADDPVPIGA